jgi:hypothetical protein
MENIQNAQTSLQQPTHAFLFLLESLLFCILFNVVIEIEVLLQRKV